EVLASMGCGLRGMALYGGRAAMDEHRAIKKILPQIIFATPGRLNDHLDKENISAKSIRILIIDEFDKCLRMGFRQEMEQAINKLPCIRRRILLSATDAREIPEFVNMNNALCLDYLHNDEQLSERVELYVARSENKDKLESLARLLCQLGSGSSIVFVNYRDAVERVADYLAKMGFVVCAYHGGKDQRQREEAIFTFSNASANVLVCTDLASRGLDIPHVNNIIHYHMPVGEDEMIHRVGRTGRWNETGQTIFLLGPEETLPDFLDATPEKYVIDLQATNAVPLPLMATIYIGKGKRDKISKGDILGFLCKTGGLTGADIGRIDIRERFSYAAVKREMCNAVTTRLNGEKLKGIRTAVEMKELR
ncbi:MAG: helicase-related protein, partial [Prevotella sp.]